MFGVRRLSGAWTWLAILVWIGVSLVVAMLAANLLGVQDDATLAFLGSPAGDAVFVAVMAAVLLAPLAVLALLAEAWGRAAAANKNRLARRSSRHGP